MIINLISSPRNISTAMMYAFAHRSDTKVMDEPFYGYYLNLTDAPHPGKEAILASQPHTLAEVKDWIAHTASQHEVVFIKNMAQHLINLDMGFLKSYKNVFLIRHPRALITSFAKVIPQPKMTDIGAKRQLELYDYLSNDQDCPVVDAGEVLKNPEIVLTKLCQKLNLTFDPSMLHWQPGALPEDGIWASYWYDRVHASSGFESPTTNKNPFPANCNPLLEEALPIYEKLFKKAIMAGKDHAEQ